MQRLRSSMPMARSQRLFALVDKLYAAVLRNLAISKEYYDHVFVRATKYCGAFRVYEPI
jgi:hypothetical protein